MNIRKAEEKDIDKILDLLLQVLEVHASVRPDLFIHGATKYTRKELLHIINEEPDRPIFVGVNEADEVLGYVFCEIKEQKAMNVIRPYRFIYIDDLCVDEKMRGQHVASALFRFVAEEARKKGFYEINLNVWEGNDNARKFYETMGLKPMKTTMEYIL